jgi:hypothetical protein
MAKVAELGFFTWPLRNMRAWGSVVEQNSALVRRFPRKSTSRLRDEPPPGGFLFDFLTKLFWPAQASITVPSTVKCFTAEKIRPTSLVDDALEELAGNVAFQEPISILGEDRHVPNRIIHVHAEKPAEEQVILELLHELASLRIV